jgi:hypothetical protein
MVAVGAWPVEYHHGAGKPSEWEMIGGPGYYGIPLDALMSRDTPNLFAAERLLDGERMVALPRTHGLRSPAARSPARAATPYPMRVR